VDDLYGNYDRSNLIDNDFIDGFQFPAMKREVYAEEFQNKDGIRASKIRDESRGIQISTLFHIWNFPIFSTQFVAMQCTKLLTSRMHGGSLWLDK